MSAPPNGVLGIVALLLVVAVYFLPVIAGATRGKVNGMGGVVFVNIFFGWTLIGWLIAFVWACSGRTHADERRDEARHREILAGLERK